LADLFELRKEVSVKLTNCRTQTKQQEVSKTRFFTAEHKRDNKKCLWN